MTAVLVERTRLRVLPIPDSEPAGQGLGESGSSPGSWRAGPWPQDAGAASVAGPGQSALALTLVGSTLMAYDEDFGPRPTATAQLPDPAVWAGRVVQAVVEVAWGVRPAAQLVRWTSREVHASLVRRSRTTTATATRRPVVRSVRVCPVRDGVVEACAVVVSGGRARAVAVRLEGLDGRWQATALELG